MRIGLLKESGLETRVGLVPRSLKKLQAAGFTVAVEVGAGLSSGHQDSDYNEAGAEVLSRKEILGCDIVVGLHFPSGDPVQPGTVLVCVADPFRHPQRVRDCCTNNITLLSLDVIPRRLTNAQGMDVNSSQDALHGYQAVVHGASMLPKAIPMLTTAAGSVRPAKALVMGSGVAGLQAIATANRMGFSVSASDVRLSAATQIESVGGRFIRVDGMEDHEDASGYAKPLSEEVLGQLNEAVANEAERSDLIITSARIFGQNPPKTLSEAVVERCQPDTVIVDLNADIGGNCELTVPGETVVTNNRIHVVGEEHLARRIPKTASAFFSNNVTDLLSSLSEDGNLNLSEDNPILTGSPEGDPLYVPDMGGVLVCHDKNVQCNHTRLQGLLS
ncbi:MAG: NAD(P)(+) transhydrogenase (Re/Si-specific) subunit alpha [Planctomycetota bacterium]|nr:NAD(P)(+) transhydrogenase (Re/Si-specific) subunit alpha [Planctomycetota bacterium]